MFKIYRDNRSVLLTDKGTHNSKNSVSAHSLQTIFNAYSDFVSGQESMLVLYSSDLSFLYAGFASMFEIVEAAGGLVQNGDNFLFIHRRGKWDLPKGKIELGEEREDAALREVQEECGVDNLTSLGLLTVTYHIYTHNGNEVLKPTYWYRMETKQDALIPQTEEDIDIAQWTAMESFPDILKNTFPSIADVLMSAGF